jgi:hypothetical protein
MDPASPVAQLAVAAISGAAFLISILVVPFPEAKSDSSAGVSLPSQASTTITQPAQAVITGPLN